MLTHSGPSTISLCVGGVGAESGVMEQPVNGTADSACALTNGAVQFVITSIMCTHLYG